MRNKEPEGETFDGIRRQDWARVHECAVNIANAALADDEAAARQSTCDLLHVLEGLERRYGALPSILATRADYTDDPPNRLTLYRAAYAAASARGDARNLVWIASSLAELYAEELRNPALAGEWLDRLETHLSDYDDEDEREELTRLRGVVVDLLTGAGPMPLSAGPERE